MIGSMREEIRLKEPINTMTDGGGHITTWDLRETEFAKVDPVRSNYGLQDSQMMLQDALKFTIRYKFYLQPTWLIQYQGHDYTITSIKDVQGRHRFMEVIATTNNNPIVPIITT